MARRFKIHETARDDELGVIRKQIKAHNLPPFHTPTKCQKNLRHSIPAGMSINEVTKRIYPKTLESIQKGTYESPRRSVWPKFLRNKLNLTIFELLFDTVPNENEIKSLAGYWYAASESTLFLPTVKMGMLKEGGKFSDKRMSQYLGMMRSIIEVTDAIGNFKTYIGTIPLIPPKYSRPIVRLYLEKDITAFAIDAGTKDFLNHETDFRVILMEINEQVPIDESFIYACNLGIPRFVQNRARADDFLSIFAYVDAFGSTFKTRGGWGRPKGVGRAKEFRREELAYEVSTYQEFFERRGQYIPSARLFLNDLNQREQLREANKAREVIGEGSIQKYLSKKDAVDDFAMKHLGSIADKVKVS